MHIHMNMCLCGNITALIYLVLLCLVSDTH